MTLGHLPAHKLVLVTLTIPPSGLAAFEAYEAAVLPLLARHGAQLEARVRSKDGTEETHLLWFPDSAAYDAYMADEDRAAAAPLLAESGASASVKEVESLI